MNPSIQYLKEQFSADYSEYGRDIHSPSDLLYRSYRERQVPDTEAISREFGQLNAVLGKLTRKEPDQVWTTVCNLCIECDKEAFLNGLRIGAGLALELMEGCGGAWR